MHKPPGYKQGLQGAREGRGGRGEKEKGGELRGFQCWFS